MIASMTAAEARVQTKVARRILSVLILEDNDRDIRRLRRHLNQSRLFDAQIAYAASARDGLPLLAASNFDCVFLDHSLPNGASMASLEALSTRFPLLPVSSWQVKAVKLSPLRS